MSAKSYALLVTATELGDGRGRLIEITGPNGRGSAEFPHDAAIYAARTLLANALALMSCSCLARGRRRIAARYAVAALDEVCGPGQHLQSGGSANPC